MALRKEALINTLLQLCLTRFITISLSSVHKINGKVSSVDLKKVNSALFVIPQW